MLDQQVTMEACGDRQSGNESGRESRRRGIDLGELDQRLRSYARRRGALDAAEALDLVSAEQVRIHLVFGCATLFEYLERALGYGPHAARERMRVARALASLPLITAELARGALPYSAVRELSRVATDQTEQTWLEATAGKVGREIEALVAGHARGDLPDAPTHPDLRTRVVRLELPTEVIALLRQARTTLEAERGGEVGDADLVETMCRRILDPGTGADGPAHQIAYTQCRDCKRATQNGAGRELDVRPDVIERAACDARSLGALDAAAPERVTRSVTRRMREQLFARDHYRCTVPGCRSARNLDVHHIIEQAAGGPHALWNCTLLCSGHHAALHAGLLAISGRAPDELAVRWTSGPPLPPGLDDARRAELISEHHAMIFERLEADVPAGTSGPRPDGVALARSSRQRNAALRAASPAEAPEQVIARILRRANQRHPTRTLVDLDSNPAED